MIDRRSLIVLAAVAGYSDAAPALKEKPMAPSIAGERERTSYLYGTGKVVVEAEGRRPVLADGGEWNFFLTDKNDNSEWMPYAIDRSRNPPTPTASGTRRDRLSLRDVGKTWEPFIFVAGAVSVSLFIVIVRRHVQPREFA